MPNLLRGLSRAHTAGEDHSSMLARILNVPGNASLPVDELRSLARESNPEIFYEGLLQIGQRLEAENRLEAASQVYAALVTDPSPSRERVPEGRVRTSFHDIRRRAQQRLEAMTGTGSSAHRAEFLLRRLAHETMEPTTLVGLTAASAAFRMTRLASLSSFLGSPTTNLFTRGFGAWASASLLGFGVEATVFPLASRGAAAALGRDLDWSFNQVSREIAGSFIILGAMKLTGWAAATLGNQNVGANLVFARPGTVLGGIGRSQGSPLQGILQQTGMLTGILLGHHLETAIGLRPHVDGATTFVDSLAMLVQFNAAGRLAHGIMGEGFRAWELGLDHQARTLTENSITGRGRPVQPQAGQWIVRPERRMIPATAGGHMGPPLHVGMGSRYRDLFPLHSFMTGSGEGPGGKRPQRDPTLPFITLNRDPAMKAPALAEGRDPHVVDLFPQILRRMKEGDLDFRRTLLGENILFRFTEAFPEDLERHLKPIHEYLDSLVAETKPGQESPEPGQKIPFARMVTILSEVTAQRVVFMKTLTGGFDRIVTSNPMAEEGPAEVKMEKSPSPSARGRQTASLPRVSPAVTAGEAGESSRFFGEASLPTPLVTDVGRLPLMIRTGVLGRSSGELVFIIEGAEIPLEQLQKIGDELGPNLRPETRLRLFSAREEKTFEGKIEGNRLVWQEIQDPSWDRLRRQRVFNRLVIHSPDEVYRQILIYSQDATRGADTESLMRMKGVPESWDSFLPFVTRALNLYRMAGRRLVVESESQGLTLRWDKSDQGWMFESKTGESAGGPNPLSEHFIKMREILRNIRSRASRPPEETTAVQPDSAKEVMGMEGREWLNVEDIPSLYEILTRPAEGTGEEVQNIWLHFPSGLTTTELQGIQTYLARRFPAQRTAYLYSDVTQTIHRITRQGSEIRVDELSVDEE